MSELVFRLIVSSPLIIWFVFYDPLQPKRRYTLVDRVRGEGERSYWQSIRGRLVVLAVLILVSYVIALFVTFLAK